MGLVNHWSEVTPDPQREEAEESLRAQLAEAQRQLAQFMRSTASGLSGGPG